VKEVHGHQRIKFDVQGGRGLVLDLELGKDHLKEAGAVRSLQGFNNGKLTDQHCHLASTLVSVLVYSVLYCFSDEVVEAQRVGLAHEVLGEMGLDLSRDIFILEYL
jgi:hypothetical protein